MNENEPVGDASAPLDDFASLEDLLTEAVQLKAEAVRLKEGRKLLKGKQSMSSTDLDALLKDLKRIELKREWLPKANTAIFEVQHCQCCDNYNPVFIGVFQRQSHRHIRDTTRWVAVCGSENNGLPQEVKTNEYKVPFCHFCLDLHGYPKEQLGIVFDDDTELEQDTDEEQGQDDEDSEGDSEAQIVLWPELEPVEEPEAEAEAETEADTEATTTAEVPQDEIVYLDDEDEADADEILKELEIL